MFTLKLKSWLTLALFFLPLIHSYAADSQLSIDKAAQLKLANHKKWQSLLHLKNDRPQITDPKFLLTSGNFSLEAEMNETIKLIHANSSQAACRFPARYLFLSQYLDLNSNELTLTLDCPEFKKYQDFVPFDEVKLIFASEVLSSASSMMGHTFLNVSGTNSNLNTVSHSISFFTEFDTLNPFKLIYEGIIGGMKGFFIVRPYSVDLAQYSNKEGRNIWSYNLDLTVSDRQLIKYHIWELKNIDIHYLFQNYNCATLTLYILSIADAKLRNEENLYVSPVDVVKAAEKNGLITGKVVTLANDWALNMLYQEMNSSLVDIVESHVFQNTRLAFSSLDLQSRLLAQEYLSLLINKPEIKQHIGDKRYVELAALVSKFDSSQLVFDLTRYKDPVKSPQDTIIGANASYFSGQTNLNLTFLPASHHLYGDNRQFFAESELKIGETALRLDLKKQKISLQSLTLYSVKSYIPSTKNIPQLSGSFFMGYRHQLNDNLNEKAVLELSGSFGKTFRLHRDIMVYAMFGLGMAANPKQAFLYFEPHIGTIINIVGDTKAIIEHRVSLGQFDSDALKHTSSLTYAWYGINNTTVNFSFKSDAIEDLRKNTISLGVDYHF